MACLIMRYRSEATRWWRMTDPQNYESFLSASCEMHAVMVGTSVLDATGTPAVSEITYEEFLAAEVLESEDVLAATVEVGNGRLLYAPAEVRGARG